MLILEKVQGDMAVISGDSGEFSVSADMVKGCREGDVIILSDDVYITDDIATERRRKEILSLQNSL
ncbi:MAG: DUF3006 domain-containing protein, partial [Huintestinicola sp.]